MQVPSFLLPQHGGTPAKLDEIDAPSLWEARLPLWLPVLLALVLSMSAGALIATGQVVLLVPLVLIVPAGIVLVRYPFAAILVWVLLAPFFVETVSTTDRYMYWIVHRALIPTMLVVVLLSNGLRISKPRHVGFGRAELAMLGFIALVLVNIGLFSPSPSRALIQFFDRVFVPFSMYWLVRLVAPTERDLKRFVCVAFIMVIVQSAIGLLGWFMPQALPEQWLGRIGQRTVGTLGNPAVYTSTLIFLALFVLHYARTSTSRVVRALLVCTFAFAFLCVFFSFSRGSWLGGLLVWAGLIFVYRGPMLRLTVVAVIVMSVLSSTLLATQLPFALERLQDEGTAEGRVVQNVAALNMIQRKPWLGWGFSAYDLYDEQFNGRVADIAARPREQTSHNTFLLISAELGVPALLLYVFPVGWWLARSRKVWHRLPRAGFQSWHLVAILWLLVVDHFTVNNFMAMFDAYPFGTTVWWLALGLIASQVTPYLKQHDTNPPRWVVLAAKPSNR